MKKFLLSFKYAFEGIWHCIVTQRNFRFHTMAALSALILSLKYQLTRTEILVLTFTIIFVLISEMINTALEAVVDMTANGYNSYAKIAKDVVAGAVLVSAIAASITGIVLFYRDGYIWQVLGEYIRNPLFWLYIAIGIVYISGIIFNGGKSRGE